MARKLVKMPGWWWHAYYQGEVVSGTVEARSKGAAEKLVRLFLVGMQEAQFAVEQAMMGRVRAYLFPCSANSEVVVIVGRRR